MMRTRLQAALFPNEVGDAPFSRFWNFMCRQVYVLTRTYATGAQRYIALGGATVNGVMHASIFCGALCTATFLLSFTARLASAVVWQGAPAQVDLLEARCIPSVSIRPSPSTPRPRALSHASTALVPCRRWALYSTFLASCFSPWQQSDA